MAWARAAARTGGRGLDAQWLDDFHHSLRTLLTEERSGYYADYGLVAHLVNAIREGFVYSGEYSAHRQRKHGSSSTLLSPFIPLLFMGEEYAEEAPFLYFVSHGDADLIRAVREGRKLETAQ